jgi:hypothetical protein
LEHANPPHPTGLLRTRGERPRHRTAENGNEIAPSHVTAQPQGTGFQDSRLRLGCARTGLPEVAAEGPVRVKLGGASSV